MKRSVCILCTVTVIILSIPFCCPAEAAYTYRTENGCAVISAVSGLCGELVIPASVDGYAVVAIDDWAFEGNNDIESVILPEGITKIGDGAFSGCKNLKAVVLKSGITSIGWDAFSNCSKLTEIALPDSVVSIGGFAFSGCTALEKVKLSSGVAAVANFSFEKCRNLKTVYLPAGIKSIGLCAFCDCGIYDIYYDADKTDRLGINTLSGNKNIYSAVWHYGNAQKGSLAGDVNGDGSLNNKDLTRLFQSLSGWQVEINEPALDINCDGSVNNKDLTRLFQYLSDWEVEIF